MDRIAAFRKTADHPWLGRIFKKLSKKEIAMAEEFIARTQALDADAFELAVNRMFLDKQKPKHFTEILELLSCCIKS